jgi:hypothetical protein
MGATTPSTTQASKTKGRDLQGLSRNGTRRGSLLVLRIDAVEAFAGGPHEPVEGLAAAVALLELRVGIGGHL